MNNEVIFVLTVAPEIIGSLFVVGWPWFYRWLSVSLLDKDINDLQLESKNGAALAFVSHIQDLNLATVGAVFVLLSAVKLIILIDVQTDRELQLAQLGLLIGTMMAFLLVLALHLKTDAREYRDINTTGVPPFFWPSINPAKTKFRVAGPKARFVFLTRLLWVILINVFGFLSGAQIVWDWFG